MAYHDMLGCPGENEWVEDDRCPCIPVSFYFGDKAKIACLERMVGGKQPRDFRGTEGSLSSQII